MQYTYQQLSYEKRALTENIVVQVISDSYDLIRDRSPEYEGRASVLKAAEIAGQSGACPVVGREELKKVIDIPRSAISGFRARTAQIGSAVAVETLEALDEEEARYQIANGSIVTFAKSFSEAAVRILLSNGILPLVSDEEIPTGAFVCILKLRTALLQGQNRLEAYRITDCLEPIRIRAEGLSSDWLGRILEP